MHSTRKGRTTPDQKCGSFPITVLITISLEKEAAHPNRVVAHFPFQFLSQSNQKERSTPKHNCGSFSITVLITISLEKEEAHPNRSVAHFLSQFFLQSH